MAANSIMSKLSNNRLLLPLYRRFFYSHFFVAHLIDKILQSCTIEKGEHMEITQNGSDEFFASAKERCRALQDDLNREGIASHSIFVGQKLIVTMKTVSSGEKRGRMLGESMIRDQVTEADWEKVFRVKFHSRFSKVLAILRCNNNFPQPADKVGIPDRPHWLHTRQAMNSIFRRENLLYRVTACNMRKLQYDGVKQEILIYLTKIKITSG